MLENYLPILIFIGVGLGLGTVMILVGAVLSGPAAGPTTAACLSIMSKCRSRMILTGRTAGNAFTMMK